ncbi:MAG: beta-ketoacyl-ACP synthase II [Leptotrichiaceae bacterium]|jgi:3-oxoacyl-[acyl-carrier-protein] synthase II|nr:beta-ketoacyl-ACP synthase II [Leptotrichiaceae bacterium]MBP6168156.1 beta-ketoacyl-ACP synthase II [Leptotrichiaceae bacterium]MBP7026655.1 beta-ketoacyl-ACP synthase II [Leptotrichiaceae bacterium]MBP8637263.1 beta-ketoacyl-ACP synthase II [Leptotrichiaceae bacterium]MBP9538974.1 beta-ketoacyl-ACP synthase II [Leptotrichiaceae bacterium]
MRRVVVTGIGLITSLGIGKQKTWERVLNGECGIDKITAFDTTEQSIHIAGEVKDFNPEDYIEKKEIKKLARFSQFAVAASKLALEDSKFVIDESNAERTGVIVGSGIGGLEIIETEVGKLLEKGSRRVSPFYIPGAIVNMAAGNVSIYLGAKGPNTSVVTACAAGTNSIGDAYEIIKLGKADTMIAGGAEATITPSGIAGFANLKALSTIEDPKKASRPFTADRAGFVMGEGAGILILEELEQAKARGAKIYAEIVGYGSTGDAYHMTSPSEGGEGAVRAMKMALDEAEADITEVDYINAHGTSTPANDKNETAAIKTLFGDHAYKLAVSSTKGATGHILGGTGGVEAGFLALAINEGILPPTINQDNPDPICDLDYVPNKPVKRDIRIGLSNTFGFGGHNAVIAMKKYNG